MADEEKKDQEQAPEAEEKAEEKAPEAEEKAPEAEDKAKEKETPDAWKQAEKPASDDDEMDWKAIRRLERSREPHEAGPQRSPEDRAAERGERRKTAAAQRSRYRKRQRTKREKGTGTPPAERAAVARKIREGRVVSSKGDKTITVRIDVARRHSTYEKIVRRSGTLRAHDETNEATDGDLVRIVETRPLSKTKRWRLTEILEKAK